AAPGRRGDEPAALQKGLRPGVAPGEAVGRLEVLVKVLDGETPIALAIELLDFLRRGIGHRAAGAPANPPIDQPVFAILFKPARPPPECPLTHSQNLGSLELAQSSGFPATQHIFELQHSVRLVAALRSAAAERSAF